jgi:hypothetical protein
MTIETGIMLTVYANEKYRYEVEATDEYNVIQYVEANEDPISISFASLDEMEAVAKAMLKTVKMSRDSVDI